MESSAIGREVDDGIRMGGDLPRIEYTLARILPNDKT